MNNTGKMALLGHKQSNMPSSLTPLKARGLDAKSYLSDSGYKKPPISNTALDYHAKD